MLVGDLVVVFLPRSFFRNPPHPPPGGFDGRHDRGNECLVVSGIGNKDIRHVDWAPGGARFGIAGFVPLA
jgi:hypothetical protein